MSKIEGSSKESTVEVLNIITKLVQDFEKKVMLNNVRARECEELKLLKSKCCDENPLVSLTGFHGIESLVKRKIFVGSQTISMLISLLPSINQYGALVTTIGNILVMDLQTEISEKGDYECPYKFHIPHPLIIVLKYNWERSWFEIYHFVLQIIQNYEDIKLEHKVKFLRPIFQEVFWSSFRRGSQFQMKLFNFFLTKSKEEKTVKIVLEALLWQEMDIYYCLFLQDFFIHLLKENHEGYKIIISGMTPALAQTIKWLIVNGYNTGTWLRILRASVELDPASGSTVLFILTDVIMETPSVYINPVVDICKSIIFSSNCSKYVAYKFVAVILNWFVNPSFLANPVYKTFEEILEFITGKINKWNDQTEKLNDNEYYKSFGSSKTGVKFAVDLILVSGCWSEQKTSIENWLRNLIDSNEQKMQLRLHSFIQGIILCEKDIGVINLCLDLLFKLIDQHKEISFSLLCLLFYKLGRETDPNLQKIYLFTLPKLSVKKENIPLIVGIIESLKRGSPRIMIPLVIQLYLSLWIFDPRTYSYLHKMLHDNDSGDFAWELNVSKAIALKEICRLAPHLHAKDLVGVLSRILNECSGKVSGLPSAFAIEAVTDLCKAYVIDVAGTWIAIHAKLRVDKRPKVISSLCRFFGNIPNLNPSGQKNEEFIEDIVSMLWNYTFSVDVEVVRNAFRALSNFPIENLPLKLLPEVYRMNIKIPKDFDKNSKTPEDLLNLLYVPAECWVQFLGKIDEAVLSYAGDLIIAFIERELTSMPRGFFYLPLEKSEPLSYSYLPQRSICRGLVEHLQRHSKESPTNGPFYMTEIIRILSHEHSKLLPPLNWGFLENILGLGSEYLRHCLALLAKQGSVSSSAKSILENYFVSVEWNFDKLEDILFIYTLLPLLCKSLSYNILQKLLERTIHLCLETSLNKNTFHLKKILQNLTQVLKNKSVQPSQKKLISKQLEEVLNQIPPEHEAMKDYATCATEFPVQTIEKMTSVKDLNDIDNSWLRRAFIIRSAIAMRSDIKNPLVWFNEFMEISAQFPNEQNFILNIIWRIIRNRRDCDHRSWMQELIWRIQASFITSTSQDSNKVILFLVDLFITAIIILSGYDCLFVNIDDFTTNKFKKLEIFPHALSFLFSFPDWSEMLPKMGSWLQKLSEREDILEDKAEAFIQALFMLRIVKWTLK